MLSHGDNPQAPSGLRGRYLPEEGLLHGKPVFIQVDPPDGDEVPGDWEGGMVSASGHWVLEDGSVCQSGLRDPCGCTIGTAAAMQLATQLASVGGG